MRRSLLDRWRPIPHSPVLLRAGLDGRPQLHSGLGVRPVDSTSSPSSLTTLCGSVPRASCLSSSQIVTGSETSVRVSPRGSPPSANLAGILHVEMAGWSTPGGLLPQRRSWLGSLTPLPQSTRSTGCSLALTHARQSSTSSGRSLRRSSRRSRSQDTRAKRQSIP